MSGLEYCPNNIHKYFFFPITAVYSSVANGRKKKKKKTDSCEGQLQIDVFKFKVVCYGRINTP